MISYSYMDVSLCRSCAYVDTLLYKKLTVLFCFVVTGSYTEQVLMDVNESDQWYWSAVRFQKVTASSKYKMCFQIVFPLMEPLHYSI